MSHQLGLCVSQILLRYFGEIVQQVGDDLFTFGCKPVVLITKSTGLTRSQVIDSLRTLLKFDLATFEPSVNENVADYKLLPENVLLLIRYPRYLLQMKSKYGSEAELLVEELLQQASCTCSNLLLSIATKYKDDKEKNINIINLKDTFISLATAGYIQQAPVAEIREGSELPTLVPVATIVPDIEVRPLILALNSGDTSEIKDNVYWKVNYERFHLDFRDDLMIKAVSRRIDDTAGELMRLLLQQMYLVSGAWAVQGNPTSLTELKELVRHSDNQALKDHLPTYLRVLEENSCGMVVKTGSAGGGQYSVRGQVAATELLHAALDHVVTERLGGKAARIYRLIRAKKYIEEEDIQKHAMLPNKECKELTYKLLEEHFISVQPMRKAASSSGLAKAVYLYHIKLRDVALSTRSLCVVSLRHVLVRGAHTRATHGRQLDKRRRVRTIVHGMRLRHEPPDNIRDVEETITPPEHLVLQNVERQLKQLSVAELQLDNTLFILKLYFQYPH